jgi:hypothetical protein
MTDSSVIGVNPAIRCFFVCQEIFLVDFQRNVSVQIRKGRWFLDNARPSGIPERITGSGMILKVRKSCLSKSGSWITDLLMRQGALGENVEREAPGVNEISGGCHGDRSGE